jgi:hypothetical protein
LAKTELEVNGDSIGTQPDFFDCTPRLSVLKPGLVGGILVRTPRRPPPLRIFNWVRPGTRHADLPAANSAYTSEGASR